MEENRELHEIQACRNIIKEDVSDLVWLLMEQEDLKRWLAYFEDKEDFEKCIEIRDVARKWMALSEEPLIP